MKTLRPYQNDAIAGVHRDLAESNSTIVVLPTGLGKTVVAAKLMTGWENGNSLFLAHTTELIEQAAESLTREMDGLKPIVEMNVQGADAYTIHQGGLIVVGSVQSMYTTKRLNKYGKHPFGLVIIDEAHRASAQTYRKIIDFFRERNPSCKVVGLTATPTRADGTSLGLVFEKVAIQLSIGPAIDDGWLVPIRQKAIRIEGLDFSKLKSRLNEFGERDFSTEQLESIVKEEENLQAFAKAILEEAGDRPTLIFTPGVQSAHLLASILCRHHAGCAEAADGETPKELRKEIIARFKAGKTQFLASALLFCEGFDAPNCACLAMCRPTKSVGRYVQFLGRGLRPLGGVVDGLDSAFDRKTAIFTSEKPDALVLDFCGVSEHKLVDVWDVLGGNYDAEIVELAEREGDKKNISADLEKAKHLRMLRMKWEERKPIVADEVTYNSYDVDPFGGPSPVHNQTRPSRGGATDNQINLLVNLGVDRATAEKYSRRQAGSVIDSLASKRCTTKQAALLQKYRINTEGLGMDTASNIIDAIAANGWKLISQEQFREIVNGNG